MTTMMTSVMMMVVVTLRFNHVTACNSSVLTSCLQLDDDDLFDRYSNQSFFPAYDNETLHNICRSVLLLHVCSLYCTQSLDLITCACPSIRAIVSRHTVAGYRPVGRCSMGLRAINPYLYSSATNSSRWEALCFRYAVRPLKASSCYARSPYSVKGLA